MRDLTSSRESLKVVFDQVGTPTYAGDLAEAICRIIETGQLDKTGIYHFSNEGVCSWFDFTVQIHRLYNQLTDGQKIACRVRPILSSEYQYKTPRPHYSVLDKAKVKQTFGIEIPYWTDSLRDCIAKLL